MSFSAISRKQKFCPTSRLSPSITPAKMELGKGSIECITIYSIRVKTAAALWIPTSLVKKPLWEKTSLVKKETSLGGRLVDWFTSKSLPVQIAGEIDGSGSCDCVWCEEKNSLLVRKTVDVWNRSEKTALLSPDSQACLGRRWDILLIRIQIGCNGVWVYICAQRWYPLRPSQKPPMAISALVQFFSNAACVVLVTRPERLKSSRPEEPLTRSLGPEGS